MKKKTLISLAIGTPLVVLDVLFMYSMIKYKRGGKSLKEIGNMIDEEGLDKTSEFLKNHPKED